MYWYARRRTQINLVRDAAMCTCTGVPVAAGASCSLHPRVDSKCHWPCFCAMARALPLQCRSLRCD
eukprot:3502899-Lingulodinium_polyedra.AAC.1